MPLITLADSLRVAAISSPEFDLVIRTYHRMMHEEDPDADKSAIVACRQALSARFGSNVAALKDLVERIGECNALCLLTDAAGDGPNASAPAIDAFVVKHIAKCDGCALIFTVDQVRQAFSHVASKPDQPTGGN